MTAVKATWIKGRSGILLWEDLGNIDGFWTTRIETAKEVKFSKTAVEDPDDGTSEMRRRYRVDMMCLAEMGITAFTVPGCGTTRLEIVDGSLVMTDVWP